ncbi:unnamed protein product [Sphagnum jensenii]|uniref:AP2/ERF domain-containing protein n=1 Tax=Sphagnum jensenii TaxID=128206 RepID=A0ABP0WJU6_9BRYO
MVKVSKMNASVIAKREPNGAGGSMPKPARTRKLATKNTEEKAQVASTGRSSIYRGVTRHRWTGRFEAHLWDKNCWNDKQNKKGKQGAYDDEEAAARAYDLAALKYWGPETQVNFKISGYEKEINEMRNISREEYLATLRRRSSGFSRGVSKYRGVARHHHNGRWEARIGRVFGNKYLYLGTYSTQEEAAAAYDVAAIQYRGPAAVTNFELSRYTDSGYVSPCSLANEESVAPYQSASNIPSASFANYIPQDSSPLFPMSISKSLELPFHELPKLELTAGPTAELSTSHKYSCINFVREKLYSESDVSTAVAGLSEGLVMTERFYDDETDDNDVGTTTKEEVFSVTPLLESLDGILASDHQPADASENWMHDDFASFDTSPFFRSDFDDPADFIVGAEMQQEDLFLDFIIPKPCPSLYPFPISTCY